MFFLMFWLAETKAILEQGRQQTEQSSKLCSAYPKIELIVRFDSDDLMLPDMVEYLQDSILRNKCDVFFCDSIPSTTPDLTSTFEVNPMLIQRALSRRSDIHKDNFFSFETVARENYLCAVSSIFTCSAYFKVGGYTCGRLLDDYELWSKMSSVGMKGKYFPKPVSIYREHRHNSSKTMSDKNADDLICICIDNFARSKTIRERDAAIRHLVRVFN